MAPIKTGGYLPGDPRYGLSGDTLRGYIQRETGAMGDFCVGRGRPGQRARGQYRRPERLCESAR